MKRRRPSRPAPGPETSESRRLIDKFARLLVLNGYSPRVLAREFRNSCAGLEEPKHPRDAARPAFTVELGHVVSYWYTDLLCVDGRGRPRPLPARGPGLSVADVVRRASPQLDPDMAIASLLKHKSLKRKGRLLVPTNRQIIFDPKDAAAPARGLLPLEGLLNTLERNWKQGRENPENLESTAINPAFPVSAVRAFKKKVKDGGLSFLQEIDSRMRRAEVRAAESEPRTRIGVSLCVFEDPPECSKPNPIRHSKRR